MEAFQVVQCPTSELAYTNKAILSPTDKLAQFEHIAVRYPKKNEAFVFSVISDKSLEKGKIAFNLSGRKWASLMLNSTVEAAPYRFEPQTQYLNSITFTVDFASRASAPVNTDFDTQEMSKQFSQQFNRQAFTVGQLFGFAFQLGNKKVVFELKVKGLEAVNVAQDDVGMINVEIGLTQSNTVFLFERAESSEVRLVGGFTGKVSAPNLFTHDWDFATMGVGGLSEQFSKMFRRAFVNRLLPPQFAEAIGIKYVRGILLYGPPGTGKTLIARQIGKMLLAREPKIVNGPEVLNKYVGESEANIRNLFKDAEEEQAKAGINSGLHMIIFDEIDAICKARGNSASSAGVGDNVVNQLLSKIDGVNSLNNVLLVGMTNRRDLIDEALLRPGRLELQIEIGLPNKEGRLEIFKIHTKKMSENGAMDESVNLEDLADQARNYTGAEIAGVVEAATTIAVNRVVKTDTKNVDVDMLASIKVTQQDFIYAMEHDVKPALGASEDQVRRLAKPVIQWDQIVVDIQNEMSSIVGDIRNRAAEECQPHFVLLIGEPKSGLTTLAANMAASTQFPFIRFYQSASTRGESESNRIQYMKKLFNDAARSELSCIVIDDLDVALKYCHIGPRFSDELRAEFVDNRNLQLPKCHRMLVICTLRNEQALRDLSLFEDFGNVIEVPSLTKPDQVSRVLNQISESGDTTFTQSQREELASSLSSIPFKMGIKRLEVLTSDARRDQPDRRVKMFLQRMHKSKLILRPSKLSDPFLYP